jgi:integrase
MASQTTGRKNPNPPALPKRRLTKELIKHLPAPAAGYLVAWDAADAAGLGVRVMPSGRRTWFWQGRRSKVTIGRADLIAPEQARKKARELAAEVELGGDPAVRRKAEREAKRAKAVKAPVHTMAALWRHYSAGDLKRRRPSTQDVYYGMWRRDLEPRFADRDAASITDADLEALHRDLTKRTGSYAANRVLALASVLMTQAVKAKWRPDNPARDVTRNREYKRERPLSPEEIERLVAVLDAHGDLAAACVEFLLLTGCRRGEALGATWDQFDLRRGTWTKPASATKTDRLHHIPLLAEASALLARLPTRAAESGPFTTLPLHHLKRRWAVLRAEAGVPDVRIHDLRHSFATILARSGLSLPMIGKLLGHANPSTTARYAHLFVEDLRKAVRPVAKALRRKSNVVPLPRKTR